MDKKQKKIYNDMKIPRFYYSKADKWFHMTVENFRGRKLSKDIIVLPEKYDHLFTFNGYTMEVTKVDARNEKEEKLLKELKAKLVAENL